MASPKPPPHLSVALTLFAIGATALIGLTITFLLTVDRDLKVIVGCFGLGAFLMTLMYGINVGKAISREPAPKPWVRVVGGILIFPLALFGVILIGGGLVGALVTVRAIEMELCDGQFSLETILAVIRLAFCFVMPVAGYAMLRQGLRRDPAITKVIEHGSREVSILAVPLWFRILMLTQSISAGTLVLAFAAAAAATNDCRAASWIWSPMVSISVVIVAAAIASGMFALRRRRAAQNIR